MYVNLKLIINMKTAVVIVILTLQYYLSFTGKIVVLCSYIIYVSVFKVFIIYMGITSNGKYGLL